MIKVNTTQDNLGLGGYDPVSYFEILRHVPSQGKKEFSSIYEGVVYYFRDNNNKILFDKKPESYLPQYGGYCATAISEGKTASIDPFTFRVEDNKLYLFYHDMWGNNTLHDRDSNHDNRKNSADLLWKEGKIEKNGIGLVYSSFGKRLHHIFG